MLGSIFLSAHSCRVTGDAIFTITRLTEGKEHILQKKSNKDHEIIELLEDIARDLNNYDLEFRIQELESKFSKDLSESTFNELKELKKKQNIN